MIQLGVNDIETFERNYIERCNSVKAIASLAFISIGENIR